MKTDGITGRYCVGVVVPRKACLVVLNGKQQRKRLQTKKFLPLERISHLQHQQDNRSEKFENSFNNYVNQNNQQNVLLMNMTQQLTKDLRILMMQQQCLNSQMQLMMATNNAFTNSNANTNLTQPQNFPALPMQSFPTLPMQSLPDLPNYQHPVTIQPAIASTNVNQNTATSSKQKARAKKARWVSYEPTSSE
ncbi:uncharacterized protein EV154DRAFT_121144 [Mucor mucedo]|uniref:uncharacterized protein n=1 Tax=Mucor mucedo TaxID=29922 RepID=UPI00221F99E6|nr:uncharacterized protein EV154DRAFT_121144 [Mucor mucedo]KAI7894065.1 hypothetical protein EV154DRAFT_121144 [Mucor mucedo]